MQQTARPLIQGKTGFTILEAVVSLGVLGIFFTAIATILQITLRTVGESRVRTVAAALAQEKLETARNLPYALVGTIGGIPNVPNGLPQEEVISVNGQDFTVKTNIVFIDDPFDGLGETDSIPTDYKRIRVSVEWGGPYQSRLPLVLLSDIAPQGLETLSGLGTLSIVVFNAQGDPVAGAQVHLEAPNLTPAVNLDTITNSEGKVYLPGVQPCFECYQVTVTKTGYSTDRTFGTTEVANPAKPHLSVYQGQVSQNSFAIDQLATITVTATSSRESGYIPFSGVEFTLQGTKTVGTNTLDEPVYKVNQNYVTGGGGNVTISNLEWDIYKIIIPEDSSIDFAGSIPLNPFAVGPGGHPYITLVTTANSPHSLVVTVTDPAKNPLPNATITIATDAAIATKSAGPTGRGDLGQAIFSFLNQTTYNILITLTGYIEATSSVSVSNDVQELFILNPNPTPTP